MPYFKTLIGDIEAEKRNFELKLRNSKWKFQKIFQIFLETFILKFYLFSKFVVNSWFAKQITFVKRKFQGRPKKLMKFQTGVSKFQFKVSFSTSKFPMRGSELGGTRVNHFACKL